MGPGSRERPAALRLHFGEIPPTLPVRDQIAVTVAERIVEREFPPGLRLREQLLAQEFGVSKAPVGDALQRLASFGLVESSPHRGVYVCELGLDDYEELMEYRASMAESFVVLYARKHTAADREALKGHLKQMAQLLGDEERASDFVELADRCTLWLALRAGNVRITRAMCSISLPLLRYWTPAARTLVQRRELFDRWQELDRLLTVRDAPRAAAHIRRMAELLSRDVRFAFEAAA